MRLTGKVAIVTGGARGIGAGIARCVAAEGAAVGIVDIDGAEAEKTAAALGGRTCGLAADCSDEKAIEVATERICRDDPARGDPHRAGPREPAAGVVGFSAREQPAHHVPGHDAYGAAKAGVVHLTKSMALELGPSNVRVNAICPGFLFTRAWEGLAMLMNLTQPELANLSPREIFLQAVRRAAPLGREQTPEDIGKLVCFLASDDAMNITGQEIKVDGGITLKTGTGA